jgi:hypothetical protein
MLAVRVRTPVLALEDAVAQLWRQPPLRTAAPEKCAPPCGPMGVRGEADAAAAATPVSGDSGRAALLAGKLAGDAVRAMLPAKEAALARGLDGTARPGRALGVARCTADAGVTVEVEPEELDEELEKADGPPMAASSSRSLCAAWCEAERTGGAGTAAGRAGEVMCRSGEAGGGGRAIAAGAHRGARAVEARGRTGSRQRHARAAGTAGCGRSGAPRHDEESSGPGGGGEGATRRA